MRIASWSECAVVCVSLAIVGCSGTENGNAVDSRRSGGAEKDGGGAPPVTPPDAGTTAPPDAGSSIAFAKCSLITGGNSGGAECANIEVPLDWNAPDGKKINLFVKR